MISKLILAAALTVSSAASFAGEQFWDFSGNRGFNSSGFGSTQTISSGSGMNVTLSAWSSTGNGCTPVAGNGSINDTDSCIESAALRTWDSGLGVQNRDEGYGVPSHSIDNTNSYIDSNGVIQNNGNHDIDADMVLLSFDTAVKITGFGAGWIWEDFDASVAAYNGATNFSGFGQNSWADILHQGWDLVDESGKNGSSNRDFAVHDADIYSKHWLVGSFNSAFSTTSWTDTNDGFKLNGLTAWVKPDDGTDVNAPATAGMLIALIAFMAFRRKT